MKNTKRRFVALALAFVLTMASVAPAAFAEAEYDNSYGYGQIEAQYDNGYETEEYQNQGKEYYCGYEDYTAHDAVQATSYVPQPWVATSAALPVVVDDFTFTNPRYVADGSIEIEAIAGLAGSLYFIIADNLAGVPTTGPVAAAGATPFALGDPIGINIADWQWLRVFSAVAGDITGYRDVRLPYHVIGTLLYGPHDFAQLPIDFYWTGGNVAWSNVAIEAYVRIDYVPPVGDYRELQIYFRHTGNHPIISWNNLYRLAIQPNGEISFITSNAWGQPIGGTANLVGNITQTLIPIRIVADGNRLSLYENGVLVHSVIDANMDHMAGRIGIQSQGIASTVNGLRVNRIAQASEPPVITPSDIEFAANINEIADGKIIITAIDGMGTSNLYFVLADERSDTIPVGANISTIAGATALAFNTALPQGTATVDDTRFIRVFETDAIGVIINFNQEWIPYNRIGTLMHSSNPGLQQPGTRWEFGEANWGDYRVSARIQIIENVNPDAWWPGVLLHFRRQPDRIAAGDTHTGDYIFIYGLTCPSFTWVPYPHYQTGMSLSRYTGDHWAQGNIADPRDVALYLTFEVEGNQVRAYGGSNRYITASNPSHPTGTVSLTLDGVRATVNDLTVNRIRQADEEDIYIPEPTRIPIDPAGVAAAGVWQINTPVAGHFPASVYYYHFRQGTSQPNIAGGGGIIPGAYGTNPNNFAQTITWNPPIVHAFLPNTQYTATIKLSPARDTRSFEQFPLANVPGLPGLPTEGVTAISYEHDGHNLLIHIAFEPTGNTVMAAQRIMHEDFSEAYGSDLGNYFRHGPNDNNRHGLSTWRDDVTYVRTSETEGIGNELVIGFRKDPDLAPANVSQAFRDNWIRAGVATTRNRNPGTVNRGNTTTFESAFGFYEASIQFDPIRGMWGAFWLMGFQVAHYAYHPNAHGAMGAEIDIVETFYSWRPSGPLGPHGFNNAWHWNGYGAHHSNTSIRHNYNTVGVNVYDGQFHTFAVEWTPTHYAFFLNGIEIARHYDGAMTSAGPSRISQNPNYLKFSIEAAAWAGGQGNNNPIVAEDSGEFRVNYVSVWNGPRPNIIAYMANGGEGNMDESLVVRGNAYTVAANAFTRNGYNFTGWNTCPNGTGSAHAAGSAITTSTNIVDITLYAQWEAATLPVFGLHAFNNGVINNQSLANGGTIRIWTRLDGANALVPFAGLNVTAAFPNGESAMHLVNINRLWNNQNYVNFIDVNMHAPWQRIYLTATLHGQVVELTLVNPRFFSLQAFNNGTINNQSLANNGVIRIWTQLMGTNALVPNSLVVTAVDQDNNNAMHLVRINEPWANPGFVNLVDVNFDAPWQRIYFTATVFGQTVELVLINPRPPVVPEFSLNVFNNGVINNQSLANAGLIRLWTRLDGVNANVLITEITAVDQDGNDAMVHLRRINTVGVSPQNGFDVNFNAPWQRIYLTVTAYGQTLELTLVNPS